MGRIRRVVLCTGGAVGVGADPAADAAWHTVQHHLRHPAGAGAAVTLLSAGLAGVGVYLAVPLTAADSGADYFV
ncbi:hypothetical protein D3C76_1769170 [compost metagenome]